MVFEPHGLDEPADGRSSELLHTRRDCSMVKDANGDGWLTPKEAAIELGLSVSRIYQLKNYLTHRKGNTKKSRLYFLASTLFEDYMSI